MISKKTVKFIHILWNKQSESESESKALFKGPGGPLIFQYYDKMCSNVFTYHWNRF